MTTVRRDPRYLTSIPCSLETSGRALAGTIADISLGGAGVETRGEMPNEFTLVFEHANLSFRLPCSQRHATNLWGNRKIHAQFQALSHDQQASLEQLIETLAEEQYSMGPGSVARTLRRMLRR